MESAEFLQNYPNLNAVAAELGRFLATAYPEFFGAKPIHPRPPLKRSKIIHDNIWGTVSFTWQELALIDSPIIQRLRSIHQVGLGYDVYPSATHTRFEHSLGVVTIASRVFDALVRRHRSMLLDIIRSIDGSTTDTDVELARIKQELRLAALLHDVGHSLHSHTSEKVYRDLEVLKAAALDLRRIVGVEKGEGEVISFCTALLPSVHNLIERNQAGLLGKATSDEFDGKINWINVALMIVGRSCHPFLQFLGDVVSSSFDADKLDYLIRDATAAGLPLRYDLDMFLASVRIDKDILVDKENFLEKLFSATGETAERLEREDANFRSYYETYRMRMPKKAMHVIEQIVICKLMLFSYLYHHPKVRAAEGLVENLLRRCVAIWRKDGESDAKILERFLTMNDATLASGQSLADDPVVRDYVYRVTNRLLPREVYRLSASEATHAEKKLIASYLADFRSRPKGPQMRSDLEEAIGDELIKLQPKIAASAGEALAITGTWVDVPKPPDFEDIKSIIIGGEQNVEGVPATKLFPIGEWQHAYTNYRYYIRIYAFPEFVDDVEKAAKLAFKKIIGIQNDDFYENAKRKRE